ncbi:ABC transporter permease [Ruminococcus flavefaciens]|uniref:ABC3 transporter permease C-terminal domain-containing protein n=2 Tax=Ruminococcus flavefaciens TaxID=1265 RepID=W7UMF9_RUMFL|nr:ABC transporter permease [Ruminococcus flavefaciens]EWM54988.1 hypothetical protein RF007C_03055 [Ruminococcus flavefaciens 007c]
MKHLISLSLKYIRRQKLRTFLTFTCIMLSAFILATVCTYGSSIYSTVYNYLVYERGTWEVEITSWIERSKDPEKAIDKAENHPSVDDYLLETWATYEVRSESPAGMGLIEISDGKKTLRVNGLTLSGKEGNPELENEFTTGPTILPQNTAAEGCYFPVSIKDMGYSEGDTITLTFRPATAKLDENSEIMKSIRKELKEKNGTELTSTDEGFDELDEKTKSKAQSTSIDMLLRFRGLTLEQYPLTDIEYGEPVEYTFKIAGFSNTYRSMYDWFVISNLTADMSELHEKNPGIFADKGKRFFIRVIDNYDYDEALKLLFTDLGHDYDKDFYDSYDYPHPENDDLLGLEWKSPYAIYSILPSYIIPMLIILIVAWFIARFIIDNAFEMAVQERSTHFASLRIIGASKGQIAAVVLTEALFYCFTAIPLGIITAVIICRTTFNSLRRVGLSMFEFSANPYFIGIAAALCFIAIIISAYTSAMWASRKLSPAEALNFGKPRSKKRKLRRYRSKLDLSSGKFLRRYTRKNIMASKSRFIISTITMTLGVVMFTLSILLSSFVKSGIDRYRNNDYLDYRIDYYYPSDTDDLLGEAEEYFGNKEIFSFCYISCYNSTTIMGAENSDQINDEILRNQIENVHNINVYAINEDLYKKYFIEEITGIDYAQFRDEKLAFISRSNIAHNIDTMQPYEARPRSFDRFERALRLNTLTDFDADIIGVISSPIQLDGCVVIPSENAMSILSLGFDIELQVNGREQYEEAQAIMDKFLDNAYYSSYQNMYMNGTGVNEFIKAIIKIVLVFLVSIWLVGILSMINSVNTSVLNRSRELMMLRSVGMTRKQLRNSVILETLMFSAAAAILGTAIGVGGFLFFIIVLTKQGSLLIISTVIIVAVLSVVLNIIIALAAALPAVKSLGKVESIAQASI